MASNIVNNLARMDMPVIKMLYVIHWRSHLQILTTPLHFHNFTFPYPIHYDCFRAASYKYFNMQPRFSLRVNGTQIEGTLVLTYLYSSKPSNHSMFMQSLQIQNLSSFPIRKREYALEERSMREVVVLYCNSDVVVQWDSQYSYYALFLLPHNVLIEVGSNEKKQLDFHTMRIMYYSVDWEEGIITSAISKAFEYVVEKKYKIKRG